MLKRSHYIALGLVLLLTLVVLNLPGKATARLKLAIGSVFVPFFGLKTSAQQLANEAGDSVLSRTELLRQIEQLRQQNQEFRLQAARADGLARENDRLRDLVKWQQQKRGHYSLASVVLREPANWWRSIQIDLGARNGISNNLPVLAADGSLVGRISSVSLTRSQVVLLGDPGCKVYARVENPARDTGLIAGAGPLDSTIVEMVYLSKSAELKPGQNVWTSGWGGVFPKDLLIGKVLDSRSEEYGLYTVARVKLAANLNGLDEVWVMMD